MGDQWDQQNVHKIEREYIKNSLQIMDTHLCWSTQDNDILKIASTLKGTSQLSTRVMYHTRKGCLPRQVERDGWIQTFTFVQNVLPKLKYFSPPTWHVRQMLTFPSKLDAHGNKNGRRKFKANQPTRPYGLPLGFGELWANWWYGEAREPFGIERLLGLCCPFLETDPWVLRLFLPFGLHPTRSACIVWK